MGVMVQLKSSEFRKRIESYLDEAEWDVVCQKRNGGYTLLWADDETPLARFKPTGDEDEVEVLWWNGERWRAVGEFGCVMLLHDALDFVFDDPVGVFLGEHSIEDEEDHRSGPLSLSMRPALGFVFSMVLFAGTLGGALGGLFSGAGYGSAGGVVFGCLTLVLMCWRSSNLRLALIASLFLTLPVVLAGAVGGALGATLNDAVVTQWWGRFAGLLVGLFGATLLFWGRRTTIVLSFSAGIALGVWLVGVLNITHIPWACILTSVVAFGLVEFGRWIAGLRIIVVGREAASEWAEKQRIERISRVSGPEKS